MIMMTKTGRNVTFDVLKGIAILAMIAGHCFIPLPLHHFIYIWHMPLFFLISGYFFHEKPGGVVIRGICRGLLAPYAVTAMFIWFCILLADIIIGGGKELFMNQGVGLLAINGLLDNPERYGGIYKCGPIWFLLALGWMRAIYNVLHCMKQNGLLLIVLFGVMSYGISRYNHNIYLPFFMLQGLASLIFYHIGYLFKTNMCSLVNKKKEIILMALPAPIVGMFQTGLDIWGLWFSNWIMNVYAAIGTSILLYVLVKKTVSVVHPGKIAAGGIMVLAHFGRLSILLLALHSIEKCLNLSEHIMDLQNICMPDGYAYRLLNIILQFSFCIGGLFLVERIRFVRRLYNIR